MVKSVCGLYKNGLHTVGTTLLLYGGMKFTTIEVLSKLILVTYDSLFYCDYDTLFRNFDKLRF